jgi:hypothetical protein
MAPDARFASRYFTREQARSGGPHLPTSFLETIAPRDDRLGLSDLLLGVRIGGEARAYPLDRLARSAGVVEETVGGIPIAVWYEGPSRAAQALDRRLGGRVLSFERREDGFHDRETGSRFDLEGRGVAGSLRGRRLARVPSLLTEWYGWFAHHPSTTVYGE